MNDETGFKDKTGKPIRIGDTLQLRLSLGGKHGGASLKRVIRFGKQVHLINASDLDNKYGSYRLTQQQCNIAVIIDRAH